MNLESGMKYRRWTLGHWTIFVEIRQQLDAIVLRYGK